MVRWSRNWPIPMRAMSSGAVGLFWNQMPDQVRTTYVPKDETAVIEKVHEKYVDDALFLMVTHDVNARAMSPKVKGFIQAKNWFQDFSPITMDK